MRKTCTLLLFLQAAALGALGSVAAQPGATSAGYVGGTEFSVVPPPDSCVSAADRALMGAFRDGPSRPPVVASVALELPRYPLAGTLGEDTYIVNYVDLDPAPSWQPCTGLATFDCSTLTYDGHDASDALLRTFDEQLIGVPVFAAQDGTVFKVHDGEPDMNTAAMGQQSNLVVIDHGAGLVTRYLHLKKNSVAVSVGQTVVAGQQIALAASSGNSSWPHLHFSLEDNRNVIEPFSGQCNSTASWWRNQPSFFAPPVWEFAFSRQSLANVNPPYSMPRDGQVLLSDPMVYFWAFFGRLPDTSTFRVEFWRPNGTLSYSSGNRPFGAACAKNMRGRTFAYTIPELRSIAGTWTMRLYVDNVLGVAAPLRVVSSLVPNQRPNRVTAKFEPLVPNDRDPISCRVTSDHLVDDPDYDVVRHRYVWRRNGQVVRDVDTAARSDVLRRGLARAGDVVRCDVTPGDALGRGPVTSISATVTLPLLYPGSSEGLDLLSGVNRTPILLPEVKQAGGGSTLDLALRSPSGSFVGGLPMVLAEPVPSGSLPFELPALRVVHVDPARSLILWGGAGGLPPGGIAMRYTLPAQASGIRLVFQGLVFDGRAANGWLATSNGQAIELR